MRLQSKKTVTIRNKILGGPIPWICLPLVAEDAASLLRQAGDMPVLHPDALEWRVDGFEAVRDTGAVLKALGDLREAIGQIPLIVTCRAVEEGGFREIAVDQRRMLMEAVIATGMVDLIDTEISGGEAMIAAIKKACGEAGVKLILSYHNFDRTPDENFILDRLCAAERLGGDIAKAAVMPRTYGDVLTLLTATYKARTERLEIPLITISMGGEGVITRIAGGLFGSDLTFAIGKAGSAPGQIPIGDLRKAWQAVPFS